MDLQREVRSSESAAAAPCDEELDDARSLILYIEDKPANLKVIEAMLKREPNIVLLTAMTGEIGVELARRFRPSAVLLDIHLPEMDGYAVLDALRRDDLTRNMPVIAVSADATPDDIDRALAAGFCRYITKPVSYDDLKDALALALNTPVG